MGPSILARIFHQRSATEALTIANGASESNILDLGEPGHKILSFQCRNAAGVQAATTLQVWVDFGGGYLARLYEQDDPATVFGPTLPTAGTFAFILTHAYGVRRVQLRLSQVTAGAGVVFHMVGQDVLR